MVYTSKVVLMHKEKKSGRPPRKPLFPFCRCPPDASNRPISDYRKMMSTMKNVGNKMPTDQSM